MVFGNSCFIMLRRGVPPTITLRRRRTNSISKIPPPSSTTKTKKPSPPSTTAFGTLKLAESYLRRKPVSSCPS